MRVMRRFRRAETAFAFAVATAGFAVYGAGAEGRYRDVAPASSFRYLTRNDYRKVKYFPQPICGGVVIFDEYALKEWGGETQAVDEFFADKPGVVVKTFSHTNSPAGYVVKP